MSEFVTAEIAEKLNEKGFPTSTFKVEYEGVLFRQRIPLMCLMKLLLNLLRIDINE